MAKTAKNTAKTEATNEGETVTITVEIPRYFSVERQDGAAMDVDFKTIHPDLHPDFIVDGVCEYLRDSASTALIMAYADAHDGDEGTTTTRKEWADDEGNQEKKAAKSLDLMQAAYKRLQDGERTAPRGTATPANPLGKHALDILRVMLANSDTSESKLVAKGLADCDTTQKRRDYALDVLAGNADAMAAVMRRFEASKETSGLSL